MTSVEDDERTACSNAIGKRVTDLDTDSFLNLGSGRNRVKHSSQAPKTDDRVGWFIRDVGDTVKRQ